MLDAPLLVAAILGIVEGLTEFLPVSSTGHLIVAGSLLGYTGDKAKLFEIVIQAGAILAVCWEYRAKLIGVALGLFRDRAAQRFVANLFVAFLPAAVLGLSFASMIKAHLFAPVPVASAFIVGAFVILWVERRQRQPTGHRPHRQYRRHALARCAQGRHRAGLRAHPRDVALRRDDHRRHAVRTVADRPPPSSRSFSPSRPCSRPPATNSSATDTCLRAAISRCSASASSPHS